MRGVVLGHTDCADDTDFLEPWAALRADSTDFLEPRMALIRAIRPIRGRSLFRVRYNSSSSKSTYPCEAIKTPQEPPPAAISFISFG